MALPFGSGFSLQVLTALRYVAGFPLQSLTHFGRYHSKIVFAKIIVKQRFIAILIKPIKFLNNPLISPFLNFTNNI
jgi:hypothetical protein